MIEKKLPEEHENGQEPAEKAENQVNEPRLDDKQDTREVEVSASHAPDVLDDEAKASSDESGGAHLS